MATACGHAPGTGANCNHGVVASNVYGKPNADGSNPTADMRDGDSDSGSAAPNTSAPATGPNQAGRGSGTP